MGLPVVKVEEVIVAKVTQDHALEPVEFEHAVVFGDAHGGKDGIVGIVTHDSPQSSEGEGASP